RHPRRAGHRAGAGRLPVTGPGLRRPRPGRGPLRPGRAGGAMRVGGAMTVLRAKRAIFPDGERPATITVHNGQISAIGPYDATTGEDLGDLVLLPGLVDTHVHVNEPGRTEWEGFATATRAAAAGGVTTIVDMPLNSVPPTMSVEALEAK